MKIRHVYTVVRESKIKPDQLKEEIECFRGIMQDETGEFLYGGGGSETITVKLEIETNEGAWKEIL